MGPRVIKGVGGTTSPPLYLWFTVGWWGLCVTVCVLVLGVGSDNPNEQSCYLDSDLDQICGQWLDSDLEKMVWIGLADLVRSDVQH